MTKRRGGLGVGTLGRDLIVMENSQRRVPMKMAPLEKLLKRVRDALGLSAGSTFVRFVSDTEMARLNGAFRNKAKTTDVLSFPTEERSRPASLRAQANSLRGAFLGDIAISPVVARRNAKRFGRKLEEEICILMLHGILHLLGYDHETDRGEMERVEARLRRRLRLS
jgi:rRNA maturation RNase YbeY